jgi:hypothetical protein
MTHQQTAPGTSQDHVNRLATLVAAERRTRPVVAALAAARIRERRARVVVAVCVPVLCAVLAASFGEQLWQIVLERQLTPVQARQEADYTLRRLGAEIESFRQDYHELPDSLFELGPLPRGAWTYVRVGKDAYRLRGTVQAQTVTVEWTANAGARLPAGRTDSP